MLFGPPDITLVKFVLVKERFSSERYILPSGYHDDRPVATTKSAKPAEPKFRTGKSICYRSKSKYEPGKSQDSYDKQIVRDYLAKDLKWDANPPVPELPKAIVEKTVAKYKEVCDLLIG